ncbi:uncharacterized protein LOC115335334 isoform X1 [Aquila chrysaetos chrysaetos]|uniref:uncharacterized protein LOC115335334 isoform X1 n=1 Tax=Aquila chrysaetos chrysaetos TaxID=223781 RepID=UPI001176B6CA|nr:uncharacterized protein LOC115335334 isoform X1 [Aquila chrysaetos chrysaetos]
MGGFPALLLLLALPGENWNWDADLDTISFPTKERDVANSTDDSCKDHRTLYALMVLSSFLPTTALIATVLLLLITYIRRKRAGKWMDFGRHPSFRQAALQKDGRNKASRMPEGEPNDRTIYAVIRHQPQPKPEDVIYVNTQPSPEVFFCIQEPPSNSVSSGPMEYATVIFRATNPHSGTEKRKTGPPKQNSTKPWAYSQNFAERHLETIHL